VSTEFTVPVFKHKRDLPSLAIEGTRYGLLTATKEFDIRRRKSDGRNRCYQKFICDCGNAVFLVLYSVKNGNTRSCGCFQTLEAKTRMTTHGQSRTSAYKVNKNRKRRAQKLSSQVEEVTTDMLKFKLEEFNNTCWICETELTDVTWDHVQPLSRGGAHVIDNLKPACRPCNTKKNAIWPFTEKHKEDIAVAMRASRIAQAPTLPVTDGLEVSAHVIS
jgi:5-methylcytosine-specific restriction endonuclease McrA